MKNALELIAVGASWAALLPLIALAVVIIVLCRGLCSAFGYDVDRGTWRAA